MDDHRPPHPFGQWVEREKLKYEEVAAWCRRLGRPTSPAYLKQIGLGHYEPGYQFSKFLAETLTSGAFTVDDLKTYPYRRGKRRA
jgi:hypothetical protein